MNKRWQPLPMAVASTVLKSTWNKQHPAPKAVAYLWVWALLDRCSPVTRRELAAWADYGQVRLARAPGGRIWIWPGLSPRN